MSSTRNQKERQEGGSSEQEVADYLRTHPDLFIHRPELLTGLRVPHDCGPAVSLIEYQVRLLRGRNDALKRKLDELIAAARENDRITDRLFHLAEALLAADGLVNLMERLERVLRQEFRVDQVVVRLFDPAGRLPEELHSYTIDREDPSLQARFASFFATGRPLCGRLQDAQTRFLFGDKAERVGSAVLIPIGPHARYGVVAAADRNPDRFHPGMGTVMLQHMSRLLGAALGRYLEP